MRFEGKNFTPLKKMLKTKLGIELENDGFLFKCINVATKDEMYLYNYGDAVLVPRDHPVLVKCRGIVVRRDGKLLNYPFDRFFNDFEKERASLDWSSAVAQEKVDGSLVSVFWNGSWEVTTRGSFYPNNTEYIDYAELFRKHFKNFDLLDKGFCYVFEMVTEDNYNITLYDEEFMSLIMVRNLNDLKELSQGELDSIAETIGAKRPEQVSVGNVEKCKKMFFKLRDDEEGFVVVDKFFNRLKLKQDSYFRLMKIKMLNDQALFDYVLGRFTIDSELLDRCPEVSERVKEIGETWHGVVSSAMEVFEGLKGLPSRKEFAAEAMKYPFSGLLFSLFDGKDLNSLNVKWRMVERWSEEVRDVV